MKEIKTILNQLDQATSKRIKTALATVVNVYGSSYRRTGARMLIQENGHWFGSVSGGCLEADVIEKAKEVIESGKTQLFRYDTRQNAKNSFGMGYGCNGMLEILIEPIAISSDSVAYTMMEVLRNQSGLQGLSTVFYSEDAGIAIVGERLHSGGQTAISNKDLEFRIRRDLQLAVEEGKSKSKTYKIGDSKVKVFHEIFQPNINILIYGAVFHVVPFMRIANELGYNVHVTDSFEPIQPVWNFPDSEEITILEGSAVDELVQNTSNLAIVFLTHNFFYIKEELPKALRSNAPYVGILGSRKKTEKILKEAEISKEAYNEKELAKLHYPIGLDIGANTPEEIALSIIAEIRSFFSGRTGEPLKKFEGYIHKKDVESV